MLRNLSAMQEIWVWALSWKDPLEKRTATHASVLAWRIPGTGEPGGLPSMGSHRVGHNWSDLATTSILAWRIPWTEEPAGLQSTGSQRVGHDWATKHAHTVSFKFGSLKIYLLSTFKMFLYLFLTVEYEANFSLWLFLLIT